MKKISEMCKMLIKIAAAGMISLVILSGFCLLYSFSGVHISNPSGSTDDKWEPGQWKATMTEGLAWLRMDKNGYNNNADEKDIDILLMGSSHMEAANVAASESTAYLLNRQLSDDVYNIGTSGHTIYTCVKNVEAAVDEYKPHKYVLMETDTVDLSEKEMQSVLDGTKDAIPSYDSGMLYQVQKYFPAVKSIFKQVSDWNSAGGREDNAKAVQELRSDYDREYIYTLNAFLKKASNPVNETGSKLIIFYQPSTAIDCDGNYVDSTDREARKLFQSACEANGIIFVDMTDEFKALYEEKHILAHGFVNTAVGRGHLNKYGHRVIAQTLAEKIKEDEECR